MKLWRLSNIQHADLFDGGYGLANDGRWNTVGHAVTYCATSPSLCVLEKLVHIEDPGLLPDLVMVTHECPDILQIEEILTSDLPDRWVAENGLTQRKGDEWHASRRSPILVVPSVIVPIEGTPDRNVVINHMHDQARLITLVSKHPFSLDTRLL
jgi:RES domain-containing protein